MRTRWKLIWGTAAVLLVLLFLAGRIFNSVMDQEWSAQRDAVKLAFEKTILAKVTKVDRFALDQVFTVIQGEDKIGQPIIVWVTDGSIHTEMASSGITAAQAEGNLKSKQPEAKVLRTEPGMMGDRPVWELFYKLYSQDDQKDHFYYDYYAFNDGALIDTWRLTIR